MGDQVLDFKTTEESIEELYNILMRKSKEEESIHKSTATALSQSVGRELTDMGVNIEFDSTKSWADPETQTFYSGYSVTRGFVNFSEYEIDIQVSVPLEWIDSLIDIVVIEDSDHDLESLVKESIDRGDVETEKLEFYSRL